MLFFGKFKDPSMGPVDYGGRTMTYYNHEFEFSMKRYVEKIVPVTIDRNRVRSGSVMASEFEVTGYRGSSASMAWATREGRPDGAGESSLLAQRLPTPRKASTALQLPRTVNCRRASSHLDRTPLCPRACNRSTTR